LRPIVILNADPPMKSAPEPRSPVLEPRVVTRVVRDTVAALLRESRRINSGSRRRRLSPLTVAVNYAAKRRMALTRTVLHQLMDKSGKKCPGSFNAETVAALLAVVGEARRRTLLMALDGRILPDPPPLTDHARAILMALNTWKGKALSEHAELLVAELYAEPAWAALIEAWWDEQRALGHGPEELQYTLRTLAEEWLRDHRTRLERTDLDRARRRPACAPRTTSNPPDTDTVCRAHRPVGPPDRPGQRRTRVQGPGVEAEGAEGVRALGL
jgi:hypothetical protein